jgi:putative ATP-dependent endonuclease of the OLD family
MQFDSVKIQNYRALNDVDITFSELTCIIGENNSGKSSTLLALSLFISGSDLNKNDFYDSSKPIVIEANISLSGEDLEKIPTDSYSKIDFLITDNKLNLIRKYDLEGKSTLFYKKLVPRDTKFDLEEINKILSGKKGKEIEGVMKSYFPEYADHFEKTISQKAAKEIIDSIVKSMKREDLNESLVEIPPSSSKTIQTIFPETVYIPAVKDVNDEVKTKESATFGKIISILLKIIESTSQVQDVVEAFEKLKPLLNKVEDEDGRAVDKRLEQLQDIERLVNKHLTTNFLNASLEFQIPSPSLKQVFSNAQIIVNDGIRDSLDSKGDGLKRAVTFALLRAYVDLRTENNTKGADEIDKDGKVTSKTGKSDGYLFLFEEPELYLHPSAQRILFEALSDISKSNQVIVTTHSPIFFSPTLKGSFVKMKKRFDGSNIPYSKSICINVSEIGKKDLFQLICFENNSAAFFADKLVLVEGDSDLIFLKHIAKKLNPEWNFDAKSIPIVRISGKGNIAKYKTFFNEFGIDVHSILDLDVLTKGFDKIGACSQNQIIHKKLIDEIDDIIKKEDMDCTPSKEKIRDMIRSLFWREKYQRLKVLANEVCKGHIPTPEETEEINLLFSEEIIMKRQEILESDRELHFKSALLEALRDDKIYILFRGEIEAYYPLGTNGDDKPSKALNACKLLPNKEAVLSNCPFVKNGDIEEKEFELIFKNIIESKI